MSEERQHQGGSEIARTSGGSVYGDQQANGRIMSADSSLGAAMLFNRMTSGNDVRQVESGAEG